MTRCVRVAGLALVHENFDTSIRIQAYLWTGIYDGLHQKIVQLEKDLALAKREAQRQESKYREALWTLHELSNGAGHAAIKLYRAGQLQMRISYDARNRIQTRIWDAESAMNREAAQNSYPGP